MLPLFNTYMVYIQYGAKASWDFRGKQVGGGEMMMIDGRTERERACQLNTDMDD